MKEKSTYTEAHKRYAKKIKEKKKKEMQEIYRLAKLGRIYEKEILKKSLTKEN